MNTSNNESPDIATNIVEKKTNTLKINKIELFPTSQLINT